MAIPIKYIWTVQISIRSKVALLVLFSLTIFTMIVAIIRVTLSLRTRREDDSWIYIWAAIEPAVGKKPTQYLFRSHRKTNFSGAANHRSLTCLSHYHCIRCLLPCFSDPGSQAEQIQTTNRPKGVAIWYKRWPSLAWKWISSARTQDVFELVIGGGSCAAGRDKSQEGLWRGACSWTMCLSRQAVSPMSTTLRLMYTWESSALESL